MLDLYTDGSCLKNPGGAIGYAAVLFNGEEEVARMVAGAPAGTNNTAELLAVINALEHIAPGTAMHIYSDSQYVVRGITEWIKGWKRKAWRDVKNVELWKRLDALVTGRPVEFHWVRGHNGHPKNCLVDQLAGEEARKYEAVTA